MSGMTTANSTNLIRANLWSSELKDILYDELQAQKYVRLLDGFPDGNTFNIPSIGDLQVDNYEEDTQIVYRPMSTGNFTFTVDQYITSPTYITKKQQQDSFYASMMESSFVPKQNRAIMSHFEAATFAAPEAGVAANNSLLIDSLKHRWAAAGSGATMDVIDFARAAYVLKKLNVPDVNRVAIVDPSVEYTINTITNITNISNNPMWEGLVTTGIATGMRFVKNIYGFDVYTSNFLKTVTDSALQIGASATTVDFSTVNGKANLFFSAAPDVNPFIGAWRQQPEVDYEFNKDFQRHEYVTSARYGVKLYRPENMIRVLSKTNI